MPKAVYAYENWKEQKGRALPIWQKFFGDFWSGLVSAIGIDIPYLYTYITICIVVVVVSIEVFVEFTDTNTGENVEN